MPSTLLPPQAGEELPEHVRLNRAVWDVWAAEHAASGEHAWAAADPSWSIWDVPEADLQMLPADMHGMDAIELGCGTADASAGTACSGARVLGIDNSAAQRATAARLLRPGGPLVFLSNSCLMSPCAADEADVVATEHLRRPAFGMDRLQHPGVHGVEFHLSPGDWIGLLHRHGFEIEDLIDVRPPETGRHTQHAFVTRAWARQWPGEEAWKPRKRG